MIKYESWLFPELYTEYDKTSDANKQTVAIPLFSGSVFPMTFPIILGAISYYNTTKGTLERFVELKGSELDDALAYNENLPVNLIDPKTATATYIAFQESMFGYLQDWEWFFNSSLAFRRGLRAIFTSLNKIRSTPWCYDVMFAWLGLTVTITPNFGRLGGFDSATTLDDPVRTLDNYAYTMTDYVLDLVGTITLTSPILQAIETIIIFNQDADANLVGITYNGLDIHSSFNFDPEKINFKF